MQRILKAAENQNRFAVSSKQQHQVLSSPQVTNKPFPPLRSSVCPALCTLQPSACSSSAPPLTTLHHPDPPSPCDQPLAAAMASNLEDDGRGAGRRPSASKTGATSGWGCAASRVCGLRGEDKAGQVLLCQAGQRMLLDVYRCAASGICCRNDTGAGATSRKSPGGHLQLAVGNHYHYCNAR